MGQKINEHWAQIFRDWEQSGLSRRAFCAERKISKSQFYYHWAKANPSTSIFKKVEVIEGIPEESSSDVSIIFPSGATLALTGLTLADLKELLS